MSTETADHVILMDPRAALARWQPTPFVGDPVVVALPPMLVNVLDSLCEGKSNRGIGKDWGISEDTVKTHLKRLYCKLGARDRVHAVAMVFSGAVDVRVKPGRRSSQWAVDAALGDYL